MIIQVELIPSEKKDILQNLLEKYYYEFSQYELTDVDDNGLYSSKNLDTYLTEKKGFSYFIKVNNKLAGFILIDKNKEIQKEYSINEFFVMYKYKKLGVGTYAIKQIFNKYKGKWYITYAQINKPANKFWNKVVKEYTYGKYELIENHMKYNDGIIRDKLVFYT